MSITLKFQENVEEIEEFFHISNMDACLNGVKSLRKNSERGLLDVAEEDEAGEERGSVQKRILFLNK